MRFPASIFLSFVLIGPAQGAPAPTDLVTSFEPNRGQFPPEVRFVHRNPNVGLRVLADGTVQLATRGWIGALRLAGSREGVAKEIVAVEPLAAEANVFVGPTKQDWLLGIPLSRRVLVRGFGEGVDLELSSDGLSIRLELRATSGIDPSRLRFSLDGVDVGPLDADAVVPFEGGSLGLSTAIATSDAAGGNLAWVTTLNVTKPDDADILGVTGDVRLARAEDGSIYVGGAIDRGRGVRDAFVVKLKEDRSTLEWVAYLGGSGDSEVSGIVITEVGDPVVTGRTNAPDFPSVRPVQPVAGGGLDAFVSRISKGGSGLPFSTLFGGEGRDGAEGIATDTGGTVRITGSTSSTGHPFAAADEGDAFVATIDTEVGSVRSTTTFDRGGSESGRAIVLDHEGNALLVGVSRSADTSRPLVARVRERDPGGSKLAEIDDVREGEATSVALDPGGTAWIGGWRRTEDGDRTAFLALLPAEGPARVVATAPAPAPSATSVAAIAPGPAGDVWLARETETGIVLSRRFPNASPDPEQVAGSVFGFDRVGGIALSPDGTVLVAGSSREAGGEILVGPIEEGGSALLTALAPRDSASLAAGCPGTINFDNSAGTGQWSTATNWDPDRLPVSTDDVCIGPGFSVALSTGAQSVGTLFTDSTASLAITGGSLTIADTSEVNGSFTLSAGTVLGTGAVTVSGPMTWTGGQMTGAGTTNLNGSLSIGGSSAKSVTGSRVLNTLGATTWTGTGDLQIGTGGVVNNSGLWDCQNDRTFDFVSGLPATFNNTASGTFRKSVGVGTTSFDSVGVVFNNSGVVEIQSGTLLPGAGTHTGSFSISEGATLQLGVTSTLSSPGSVVGAGTMSVTGGATTFQTGTTCTAPTSVSNGTLTFNVGATATLPSLSLSGGTLGGTGTVTITGSATWTGGQMTGAAATNLNGSLSIGGSSAKSVTGSRVLNTLGATTWTGTGDLQIGTGGVVNNSGLWDCQNDRTFDFVSGLPATFNNTASGTFRKSVGVGTTSFDSVGVVFNNSGVVEIQSGTLGMNGGGTHSGTFTGSATTTLRFGGGTHTLHASSSVSAAAVAFSSGTIAVDGSYGATTATTASGATVTFNPSSTVSSVGAALAVSGGTVTFNSGEPIEPTSLSLSGVGTIGGSDAISVSGTTTWTSGQITGSGTISTNGGMSIGGASVKDLNASRVLDAFGITAWTGGDVRMGASAVINNHGIWDCQSDQNVSPIGGGSPAFNNTASGTLRKSGGGAITTLGVSFSNAGAVEGLVGTLSFPLGYPQTSGSTTQNGGVITSPTPLGIFAGTLRGFGTIGAGVSSSGQVGPGLSAGILGTSGSYSQSAAGSFVVEIGGVTAGAQHDRLDVLGSATLAGTLDVTLINGFQPSPGDEFTLVTCASRVGTFASVLLPPLSPGRQWRIDYFDTAVKLVTLSIPAGRVPGDLPAESQLTAAKSGTDITLTWAATCVPTDTDFAVYEGVLGNYSSHVPVSCSTGGATTATLTPGAGSRYYIVAAHNGGEQGSYGYDSNSAERAASAAACHPRHITNCP